MVLGGVKNFSVGICDGAPLTAGSSYTLFFAPLYQSYGPWFMPKFRFHSISWELIDRISPNFIYIHSYWQDLYWDCHTTFSAHLYQSYGPCWEQIVMSSPNFIYAFILTRSTLELLHIIFCTFVPELWPLIYAIISFPLNILRTIWQYFKKFYICIYTRSSFGLLHIIFCSFVQELWPLIYDRMLFSSIFEDKLTEFHQILYMLSY